MDYNLIFYVRYWQSNDCFAIFVIHVIMYWATSNVCRYNFTIERKTNQLNIIATELVPAFHLTEVYYFKELNCNDVNLTWDYERVMRNLKTLSVMIYQQLTTDIKGNPN